MVGMGNETSFATKRSALIRIVHNGLCVGYRRSVDMAVERW
jgi:hypothetical protein